MMLKYSNLSMLIVMALFSVSSAANDFATAITLCANEENNLKRLSCYDGLVKAYKIERDKFSDLKGRWQVERLDKPFDDREKYSFYIQAEQAVTSKNQTVIPRLVVQCGAGEGHVEINWDIYLGKNRTAVQSRFDQEPIESEKWLISDSKRSVQYIGNPQSFIEKIMTNRTLSTKIRPHNGSPIIATFNISGLAEKMATLGLECQ